MTFASSPINGPNGPEYPRMRLLHIAAALLVPLLWGTQYAVIKVGLAVFPPLFFAGLRFGVIALLLIPFVGGMEKREIGPIFLISVFLGGVNFGGAFVGLTGMPAGIAGIANQLWTPFTLLLAWPILGERPSLRAVAGVTLAFGGVALSVVGPAAAVPIVPALFVIGSAIGLAGGNVLTKKFGPLPPVKLFAWIALFTSLQLLLLSFLVEEGQERAIVHATGPEWMAFGFTVIFGGIIAFSLWFWLIAQFSISRVAPYALLQSFFSIAAGIVLRGETLTGAMIAGAVICLAGVALSQSQSKGKNGG